MTAWLAQRPTWPALVQRLQAGGERDHVGMPISGPLLQRLEGLGVDGGLPAAAAGSYRSGMNHTAMQSFAAVLLFAGGLLGQCQNVSLPGGSGCGAFTPFGIPFLNCLGAPTIGNAGFGFTATAPCSGGPVNGAALLLRGVCRAVPLVQFNYGPGGMCGPSQAVCALHVDIAAVVPGTLASGGAQFSYSVPVPNVPQLVGLQLCVQHAHACDTVNCIAASHGVRVTLQ